MSPKKQRNAEASKKSGTVIWGGLLVIVLLTAGTIWYFNQPQPANANLPQPGSMADLIDVPEQWGIGNPDAALQIVEYGDYQCGACGFYHPIVKNVVEEFYDDVYFVFRHFPLVNVHQFATMAASAAEAAGRQGKFWEMHDLIMTNQQMWSRGMATSAFLAYARELGLNDVQFQRDMRNPDILAKIERDFNSGLQLNLNSVPTFFFNGEFVNTPRTEEAFRALVMAHIERAKQQ